MTGDVAREALLDWLRQLEEAVAEGDDPGADVALVGAAAGMLEGEGGEEGEEGVGWGRKGEEKGGGEWGEG